MTDRLWRRRTDGTHGEEKQTREGLYGRWRMHPGMVMDHKQETKHDQVYPRSITVVDLNERLVAYGR